MNAELFAATILLILVIDPFGNVPLVVSALKNVPPERRLRVVLRECAAAYVILVGFMLGGRTFLQWLHLSEESLTIAGGIILFLIAIRMVFPRPEGIFGDAPGAEPFLVPLAIPSIAGPSALADRDVDGVARPGQDRQLARCADGGDGRHDRRARAGATACSAGWASARCSRSSA